MRVLFTAATARERRSAMPEFALGIQSGADLSKALGPLGTSTRKFDAVVVGAGHNGLVASFYLARAGLSVLVVEAQGVVGGACRTEELVPGYRFSTCATILYWMRPGVVADLRLVERGLEVGGGLPLSRIIDRNR